MIKKNPSYRVTIYNQNDTHVIEYPITCKFNSSRGLFSQANKCTIELYNLNSTSRAACFKDALTLDQANWKYIKLEAGWNGTLSQIFFGKILQAYSSKSGGQTDIITYIECQPFDIFDTQSAHTFEAGTSFREAYKTMIADLKNCQFGNLGNLEGTFKTQTSYCGNTMECINELTKGNTFVDNGIVNTIMANEVIDVPVPQITDDNGLLSTPIRRNATLTIKMLFEPTLIIGQLLEINSSIQPIYNGQYKVLGFTHDCMISPTQAGQRITTVDLWIAPLLNSTDINITGEALTGGASQVNSFNKVKGETITQIVDVPVRWMKPVPNGYRVTSNYGMRMHPIYHKMLLHDGIDINVRTGTPIFAADDGTVSVAGWVKGYGKYIQLEHSGGLSSFYAHLNEIKVSYGSKVKRGQIIGYSGSTGVGTAEHLHFGAKKNGKSVNPIIYTGAI